MPPREFVSYVPHAPQAPIDGRIVSIYGDALTRRPEPDRRASTAARPTASSAATCWRCGAPAAASSTAPIRERAQIKLPDERHGLLFVFRVFERVSYALILTVAEPVAPGRRGDAALTPALPRTAPPLP